MAEIGRWNGLKFEVKSGYVMSFTDLSIKGALETEERESGSVQYAATKAKKPTEASLTAHLDARTGCDVRNTAMQLIDSCGAEDYFYIAGKKLAPYRMKLTEANASAISMNSQGVWICCDVRMSMRQSSLPDGMSAAAGSGSAGTGGSAGGSKKATVKTSGTTTAEKSPESALKSLGSAVKKAAEAVAGASKKPSRTRCRS